VLAEAIELARNYIAACASQEGRIIDPEQCMAIGGHIQVAKITPQEGFAWVTPPNA